SACASIKVVPSFILAWAVVGETVSKALALLCPSHRHANHPFKHTPVGKGRETGAPACGIQGIAT
ncbi:MAG TPA: hypothetical protein VK956_18505, partial [Verrucomicrobium sp.]|nr:hypothetical protein [Verrucomicrobium sp.]